MTGSGWDWNGIIIGMSPLSPDLRAIFYFLIQAIGMNPAGKFPIFDPWFHMVIRGQMFQGIEATLKHETSHLCALGLSTYTEIMGGLRTGNLKKERGYAAKNYEAFLPYLGEHYIELNKKLSEKWGVPLFGIVHSKLVHQFSPDVRVIVTISAETTQGHGIEVTNFGGPPKFTHDGKVGKVTMHLPPRLDLNLKEYYRNFRKGVEKYYSELVKETEQEPGQHQPLIMNFTKAAVQGTQLLDI